MKINFFILGSMKSGSTSLSAMLNAHPEIYIPQKELYYYSFTHNYTKGKEWYFSHFEKNTQSPLVIGEKCVSYGYIKESRDRIYKDFPDSKLVWILRNPIHRAISHYNHNVNNGQEIRSMSEAFEDELEKKKVSIFHKYLERGCYINEIRHFKELFSQSQIHIVLFEDLLTNHVSVIQNLLNYLGVDAANHDLTVKHRNRTQKVIFPYLVKKAIDFNGYGSKTHFFTRRILSIPRSKSFLDEKLRRKLALHFYPSNLALEEFIGKNCSW